MANRKKYDLAVKVGEYTDTSGATKARYENVGIVMEKDDGGTFIMLKRTFNPAGVPDLTGKNSENILIGMFEPKQNDGHQQQQRAPAPSRAAPPADDGIPF